ncbi:hypothetical protein C4K18_0442 [Pseudomonas chlororaphis subsp. aurantiaca]|nr:hypothetical protein C4K18_0442 [Pseudomonas chlororaphis subsp. aurantiaca]
MPGPLGFLCLITLQVPAVCSGEVRCCRSGRHREPARPYRDCVNP